jgi:hypothetical protein
MFLLHILFCSFFSHSIDFDLQGYQVHGQEKATYGLAN